MPAFWYKQGKVECLDELELFEDNDEYTNLDFKFDIEILINSGSCYGLSVYIFELIAFIQDKEKWINFCKENNVRSLDDYNELCKVNETIP